MEGTKNLQKGLRGGDPAALEQAIRTYSPSVAVERTIKNRQSAELAGDNCQE